MQRDYSDFQRMLRVSIFLLTSLAATNSILAQSVYDGNQNLPPYGGFSGGGFDTVALQNGNLHLHIPIASWQQRGGKTLSLALVFDSALWTSSTTVTTQNGTKYYNTTFRQAIVPALSNASNIGSYSVESAATTEYCSALGGNVNLYNQYVVIDPEGIQHPLDAQISQCPADSQILKGPTQDGSGMMVNLGSNPMITLKDGTQLPLSGSNQFFESLSEEDTNGNLITTTDTLQRTPWTVTNGPTTMYTTPNGVQKQGPQYTSITVNDSSGTSRNYTISYSAIDVVTSFCVNNPPYHICNSPTATYIVPSELTLPNGAAYQFSWNDSTPAELGSIVLPTGGTISYSYLSGCLGPPPVTGVLYPPASCRGEVQSRTVSVNGVNSTWTYSSTGGRSTNVVTVTDPQGNQQVHTFSQITVNSIQSSNTVETQVNYYQGTATGTPLKQVVTSYTGEDGFQTNGTQWLANMRPISVTTTLKNGLVTQTQTDYETFSYNGLTWTRTNPTEVREYDYGSGAPGPLLRRTDYTYLHNTNSTYATLNIVDRPSSVIVYNGQGSTMSKTTNEYDNYTTGIQPSGAVQHDAARSTSYLTRGNITAVEHWRNTDGAWLTTRNQYDDAGNILSQTDPLSHQTQFGYTDSWASGGSTCAPSGGQTKAFLTSMTNALSQQTKYAYFSCTGLKGSATDPNTQTTTYGYDMLNRPTQLSYPDKGMISYCYTDEGGSTCTQSSPPFQQVITQSITPAISKTTTVIFDGLGRTSQTQLNSDPDGVTYALTTYDGVGRVSQVYNPTRCASITSNCKNENTWGFGTYNYDALNRVTSVVEQDSSVVSTTYDQTNSRSTGTCSTSTDEASKSRQLCSDALGRNTGVWEDPLGFNYETDYSYDALGDLLTVTQNGSNSAQARVRSFQYDSLSELTKAVNPESGTMSYTYDNDGNLTTKVAPSPNQGRTGTATVSTTYTYDALNRMTSKVYVDTYSPPNPSMGTVTYGYDGVSIPCTPTLGFTGGTNVLGRRTSMCDASGSSSVSGFDSMGRIASENQRPIVPTGNLSRNTQYNWNLDGSLGSLEYPNPGGVPDGSSIWVENGAGRVYEIESNEFNYLWNGKYSPGGQLVSWTGNDDLTAYPVISNSYNSRLQPITLSASTKAGSTIFSETYNFHLGNGDNGNIDGITNNKDNNRSQNFAYDSLNRITTAYTTGPNWGETFTIDAWGNLTNIGPYSGKTYYQGLNASPATTNNQLPGYTYDAAGNMTNDGMHSYQYDSENRIISVDNGGTAYTYDGDGRRVKKCVGSSCSTGTIYWRNVDGETIVESDLLNNWLASYINFQGRPLARMDIATGNRYYYFQDMLQSTNVETDQAGNIIAESDYYPYGTEIPITGSDSNNHYKFTGKERDSESGLDNFGARYDASSMGRFMTPDPLGGHLEDPQTLNKYAYVRNNPTTLTDPTGLDSYLSCTQTKDNASTCQSQTVGYDANGKAQTATVQGVTNADKSFTATQIGNDANGNLVDKTTGTGTYTASANGSGVQFSNNGGQSSSTGVFVNGTPQTTFQDAGFANGGALSGFTFTLTNSKLEAGQTEAGSFTFAGTPDQAGAALQKAGFNPRSGENVGMNEYRSPGSFWTGANSSHFNVFQIGLKPWLSVPQAQGDMHFGEHNPYSPFGWVPHSSEANQ